MARTGQTAAHHMLGGGAEEHDVDGAPPVDAHDDEVGRAFAGDAQHLSITLSRHQHLLGPRLTTSSVMLRSWGGTRPGWLREQRPGAPS